MLISSSGDGKEGRVAKENVKHQLRYCIDGCCTPSQHVSPLLFPAIFLCLFHASLPCGDALHTRHKACILDATMARMNRRDCRTRTPKLGNARLDRVEALQKAIRKAKKEGRPLPAHAEKGLPAGGASTAAAPAAELSTSASDFLSQMRAATAKEVSQLRDTAAARSSSNKKRVAMPGSSSSS